MIKILDAFNKNRTGDIVEESSLLSWFQSNKDKVKGTGWAKYECVGYNILYCTYT